MKMQQRVAAPGNAYMQRCSHRIAARRVTPFTSSRTRPHVVAAAGNGNGQCASKPSAAVTARTIVEITSEGTLCTISADGYPIGIPVSFNLDKEGHPHVQLGQDTLEMHNLAKDARCSLQVQPSTYPARAVASVTLVGKISVADKSSPQHKLDVEKCIYLGGLDQVC